MAATIVRAGGGGAAFAVEMAAITFLTAGLGAEAAIAKGAVRTRKIIATAQTAKKFRGAKVASSKVLHHVTQHTAKAMLEGVHFGLATGDKAEIPVGAGFYAINRMIPGLKIPNSIGKAIIESMYKSSVGLAAASMGTEAAHVAIDALRRDQGVRTAIADNFGHGDELTERVVTELAVGAMFGAAHMPKALKARHMKSTPKEMDHAIKKSIENDKFDMAIDIANEKFNYLDKNDIYRQAAETNSKYKYLKKRLEKEELKGLADKKGLDPEKINQRFEEVVREHAKESGRKEAEIWEEVIGRDSFGTLEQKRKALEEITGRSTKEYSPGDIEVIYERMRMDSEYAVKLREGMKVIVREERLATREERIAKEQDAAKELVGTEEGIAISTEKNAEKVEKNIDGLVTKVQKKHAKEARDTERNISPKTIRKGVNRIKAALKSGDKLQAWDALSQIERDIKGAIKQADRSNIKKSDNAYKQLKQAHQTALKSLNQQEMLTSPQAERLYKSMEKALSLFSSDNTSSRLKKKLKKVTTKAREDGKPVERKFDSKTDFMLSAINTLFTGDTKSVRALSERVSSGMESLFKDTGLYEPGRVDRFEAVRSAMDHGLTRESALRRRAELEVVREKRELTNAEQMEYEILNFRDASSMSMGELAMADAALKVLINNGTSARRVQKTFEKIQERTDINEVQKMLDPKRYLSKKAKLEAEIAVTNTDKIRFLERFGTNVPKLKDPTTKKYDKELINREYERAVKEHHDRVNKVGASKVQKILRMGRVNIESFPSIMEYFSNKMPGRLAMEGHLHTFSDQILAARNGKQGELSYWASARAEHVESSFGTLAKANEVMRGWGKKKHDFHITNELTEVKLPERMTVQEAMTLLAYSRQRDQLPTFEKKGWEVVDKNGNKGRAVKELEAQIEAFGGKEAVEWVDWTLTEYLPRVYHRLNEKYRDHKGTDLEYIINYFPVIKKGGGERADRTLFDKPASDYVASTMTSAAKSRTGSTEWYDLRNFNELTNNHTERTVHYVHFQAPVLRIERTFGQESVQSLLRDHYSGQAVSVMKKFEKDIAADRTTGDRWGAIEKAKNNFVRAKLGINHLLVPKQMMSVQAYTAGLVGGKEVAAFHGKLLNIDFKLMREIAKTEFMKGRYASSSFNRDLAQAERAYNSSTTGAKGSRLIQGTTAKEALDPRGEYLKNNILVLTKLGDKGAILWGAQAQYRVVYDRMIKEGYTPKEAKSEAYMAIVRSTRRTQQSGSIEDLSHWQRYGTIGKLTSMFQNSPLQYARVEMAAFDALAQAKRDGDQTKMKKAAWDLFFFHFVMPMTFQAAMNGFYAGEAKMLEDEDMLRTMLLGSLSYIPALGGVLTGMVDYANTGESFGISTGVAGSITEEADAVLEVLGTILQGEEMSPDGMMQTASAIATMMGVPVDSPYNLYKGVREYVVGETHDPRALMGYSSYMRGAGDRSHLYPLVEKHSSKNGGDMGDAFDEFIEDNGIRAFQKNKNFIKKEYLINEEFGGYDRHVNHLNSPRIKSEEKAEYIYDLYKVSVLGQRPVIRRKVAIKDIYDSEEMSSAEFEDRLGRWLAFDVITKEQYLMFDAKKRGKFEEEFEY